MHMFKSIAHLFVEGEELVNVTGAYAHQRYYFLQVLPGNEILDMSVRLEEGDRIITVMACVSCYYWPASNRRIVLTETNMGIELDRSRLEK